jgi:precorrin-3B synthase
MTPPRQRGACPTLAEPMPTGDGLLARLPVRGTVSLDALAGLCAAARRHGNGIIEVTSRGNLQVRGLKPGTKDAFAADIVSLGLDIAAGAPVAINPLAGLEPDEAVDARGIATDIERALETSAFADELGPKISVVIDAGNLLHLDSIAADIRLTVAPAGEASPVPQPEFRLALAGDASAATPLGRVHAENAAEATIRLLAVIATRGRKARARDIIEAEGMAPFRAAISGLIFDAVVIASRPPANPLGIHALRAGRHAVGLAFPFGHANSALVEALIAGAADVGAAGLRLAPSRAILVVGLNSSDDAERLQAKARGLDLITHPLDPRRHIAACPGAPLCASTALPVRQLASAVAQIGPTLLDGSFTLHLSGCDKGCAHQGRTALTVVGSDAGVGLILDGSAQSTPQCHVPPGRLLATLARLDRHVRCGMHVGERASQVLSRSNGSWRGLEWVDG